MFAAFSVNVLQRNAAELMFAFIAEIMTSQHVVLAWGYLGLHWKDKTSVASELVQLTLSICNTHHQLEAAFTYVAPNHDYSLLMVSSYCKDDTVLEKTLQ